MFNPLNDNADAEMNDDNIDGTGYFEIRIESGRISDIKEITENDIQADPNINAFLEMCKVVDDCTSEYEDFDDDDE